MSIPPATTYVYVVWYADVSRVWLFRQPVVDGSCQRQLPTCVKFHSTRHLLGKPLVELLLLVPEASIRLVTQGDSIAIVIVGYEVCNRTAYT